MNTFLGWGISLNYLRRFQSKASYGNAVYDIPCFLIIVFVCRYLSVSKIREMIDHMDIHSFPLISHVSRIKDVAFGKQYTIDVDRRE